MTDLNPVDAMTTDYRALCAELVEAVLSDDSHIDCVEIAHRARALLAQPVAEGPTDDELWTMYDEMRREQRGRNHGDWDWVRDYASAVLAKWGHPTPQPVAVSERWPEFSDCDPQERVWAWNPVIEHWKLSRINRSVHTHWLPVNALPIPEAQ